MAEPGVEPLIEVRALRKYFPIRSGLFSRVTGQVQAVDDLSFHINPTETLGLVGESGCGKTTAGRALLRLIEPTSGSAMYKGRDLFQLSPKEMRVFRRNLQIIFQDPFSSLNPRMTVENLVGEAMQVHGVCKSEEVRDRVKELLERVGLQGSYVSRYPHEFSGGQRQRIGIARALALSPEFIVCDEAVSALDVSVQAQVINLLQDLQQEYQLSYLFIAHDLSVVRHISDRVAVMYLGRIAEIADCDEIYSHPAHPYTQALLSAIPEPNPRLVRERVILQGDVPTPINPPSGCRFHTRCPAAFGRCRTEVPELSEVASGHFVACHLYTEPVRAGLMLSEAQKQVAALVKANATTTLTGGRNNPARAEALNGDAAKSLSEAHAKDGADFEERVQDVVNRVKSATEPRMDAITEADRPDAKKTAASEETADAQSTKSEDKVEKSPAPTSAKPKAADASAAAADAVTDSDAPADSDAKPDHTTAESDSDATRVQTTSDSGDDAKD